MGYQFTPNLFGTVNAFKTRIRSSIIFPYKVFRDTGVHGLEAELQHRASWGFIKGSLSLSKSVDNEVPAYVVPGETDYMFGAANTKAVLMGLYKLNKDWNLSSTWTYLGPRYNYPAYQAPTMTLVGGYVLGNISLDWYCAPRKLRCGLLVSNVADRKVIQTWTWNLGPFALQPGQGGREFSLRVSYNY